jgi:large conductance mechanosensitive channel
VSDILLPPIALLPFINRNMHENFFVLRKGPNYPYNTVSANTRSKCRLTISNCITHSSFVDNVVSFVALGAILYLLAQLWGLLTKGSIIKHTKNCGYCRKAISEKVGHALDTLVWEGQHTGFTINIIQAQRCAFCTSWQDGREDRETTVLQ